MADGAEFRFETEGLHRDGFAFSAEIALCRSNRGGEAVFTAFVRDLTGQKQAEAENKRGVMGEQTAPAPG